MKDFDEVLVAPTWPAVEGALREAAVARLGPAAGADWPLPDMLLLAGRFDREVEGRVVWPLPAGGILCSWWRDYLGRTHVRVSNGHVPPTPFNLWPAELSR
jgi:hypothetical protein